MWQISNVAKRDYLASKFHDPDPLKALSLMKHKGFNHAIHGIGADPFYVYYWLNYQNHIYRSYAKQESATIFIDATGSIVKRVTKLGGTKSAHVFLYQIVMNCHMGQFSISQML